MTAELGPTPQEGYELCDVFDEQAIPCFGPSHEEERALREMRQVRYKNDINQFLWNSRIGMLKPKLLESC